MSAYLPSFIAARLYRKQSAKGVTYFVGRLGGVKVAVLKSKETAEDGSEIWHLTFAEAAPFQPRDKQASPPVAKRKSRQDAQRPLEQA